MSALPPKRLECEHRDGPSADPHGKATLWRVKTRRRCCAPHSGPLVHLAVSKDWVENPPPQRLTWLLMRANRSGAEIGRISARSPPAHSAFAISIAFICTYAIFALAVIPFAGNPGPKIPGISVLFAATIFATELPTSLLLFVRFRANPHWSLLILGSAFLYSALMVVPHLLTFPGAVLTNQALIGGSQQVTGYIFVLWVVGFALLTFVSVIFETGASSHQFDLERADRAVCTAVSTVSLVVLSVAIIAILLGDDLPAVINEPSSWTGLNRFLVLTATAFIAGSI